MKWFDRWFAKKCAEAWNSKLNHNEGNIIGGNIGMSAMIGSQPTPTVTEREIGDHRKAMHLQIHPATGGYILEFSRYNRTKDEHSRNLHLVTDNQDLGEAIAQVITLELLRQQ